MRFMVMVRATADSEAGAMPSQELLEAMGRYNEELVKAGVMEGGDGLRPSAKGARVHFSGSKREVVHGPFPAEQLVAGYWLWNCASLQEAIEWAKKCPNPMPGDSDLEIRSFVQPEDFGEAFTPAMREQEERLRAQVEQRKP